MSTVGLILTIVVALSIHIYICSVAAEVAEEKGHSGWFLRCFLIGPLMLILVAGLPDIRARKNQVEIYKVLKKLTAEDK